MWTKNIKFDTLSYLLSLTIAGLKKESEKISPLSSIRCHVLIRWRSVNGFIRFAIESAARHPTQHLSPVMHINGMTGDAAAFLCAAAHQQTHEGRPPHPPNPHPTHLPLPHPFETQHSSNEATAALNQTGEGVGSRGAGS